jgi:cytochrome P450
VEKIEAMTDTLIDEGGLDDLFQIDKAAAMGGGVIEDPWPIWAELLEKGSVHKGTLAECMGYPPEVNGGGLYQPGRTYYSVFSFAAVSEVFTRKDDFWSDSYNDMGTSEEFGDTILSMDGARHRRHRDLIQQFFQPGIAESWWREKVIDPLVTGLIDSLAGQESVDLNARFFARLPLHTMTSGFGLTFMQGLEFRGHMLNALHATTHDERMMAKAAAGHMLDDVIRARQENPEDDLISHLAHADLKEDGGTTRKLTVEEITSFCRLIVFAGGETTWRQMGNALYALLKHPDQLAELLADRSLMQDAILESVRWLPDPLFPRKVKRDTVLQGVALPEGAHLHLCLGAANRDPKRWENPERFDVRRPFQRSVAFAAGAHSCLGQHVARQEIAAALNGLFDRFPNIRWDPAKPPAYLTGSLVQRGPGPLHVLLH